MSQKTILEARRARRAKAMEKIQRLNEADGELIQKRRHEVRKAVLSAVDAWLGKELTDENQSFLTMLAETATKRRTTMIEEFLEEMPKADPAKASQPQLAKQQAPTAG